MAVAGDILIKIAADLAEFTTGMSEATSKIEGFGKSLDAHDKKLDSMFA